MDNDQKSTNDKVINTDIDTKTEENIETSENTNNSESSENTTNQDYKEVKTTENNNTEKPKKKKALITTIITLSILVLCGGIFAAYAIIKNQPENILADSVSNLINSKQIAVFGTVDYTPKDSQIKQIISSVKIAFKSNAAEENQSAEIDISAEVPAINQTVSLNVGEVLMKDDTIYFKISGIKKLYEDNLSDYIKTALNDSFSGTSIPVIFKSEINPFINKILSKIESSWIKVSIRDLINNSSSNQYLSQSNKSGAIKALDCIDQIKANMSDYTDELYNNFLQNKFITLTPAEDSFYKASIDHDKLTAFANLSKDTKLASDFTGCMDMSISENNNSNTYPNNNAEINNTNTDVYLKFDGFLDHHLTDIKAINDNDEQSVEVNLSLAYPSNLTVNEPADSISVIDIYQEIEKEMKSLMTRLMNYYK